MAQLLTDQMDDARRKGESRAKLLVLVAWDALANGLGARLAHGPGRRVRRSSMKTLPGETGTGSWLRNAGQDLRFASRQFRRRPGIATAAVLVLALGIGANTAVFSVVEGVLLKALPLPDADRLVQVFADVPEYGLAGGTLPGFQDWAREKGPFESLGAFYRTVHSLTGDGTPERIIVGSTTGDLFGTVGLAASLGRTYASGEAAEAAASERVVLLTDAFWRRSFGADPDVVGTTIQLDGESVLVLGVLPEAEEFIRFGRPIDAWAPMGEPLFWMGPGTGFLTVVGRLRPNLTPETAAEPLEALASGLVEAGATDSGIAMVPLREGLVGDSRMILWSLQGAAFLLMIVVAANAANLLLTQSLDRNGEFAVRAALGAGRARIVRQVLVETTLLGMLGGLAGLILAVLSRDLVLRTIPDLAALAGPAALSWGVLAYTFGTALIVGIAAGLWPAMRATTHSWSTMKEGARSVSGAQRGSRAMVAAEIGLALMLLVGAGLMVRTISSLMDEQLGFAPNNVLTLRINLPETTYPEWSQRHQFFDKLAQGIQALPGVENAALTSALPLRSAGDGGAFAIEGREWPGGDGPSITKKAASAGYFATMGIPIVAGREFTPMDRIDMPLVTVVSRSMASRFFPGEDALGKKIRLDWWGNELAEIVGVVGDVKQAGRDQGDEIAAYLSQAQIGAPDATMVIKTTVPPLGVAGSVRDAVLAIDPNQPIYAISTMDDVVSGSLASQRTLTSLLLALAAVALVISCLGIYAVTAQVVRGRREEIGIRMALGASGPRVLGSVMAKEGRVVAAGLLLGLGGAAASTSAMETLLFGVTRLDGLTLAASVATLGGVALLAALGPSLRAARTDPASALGRASS